MVLNYVAPAHRFRGVSKALLAALEAQIAASGVTEARLTSTTTALRFYRDAGWESAGPPDETRSVTGHPLRKRLGPAA